MEGSLPLLQGHVGGDLALLSSCNNFYLKGSLLLLKGCVGSIKILLSQW